MIARSQTLRTLAGILGVYLLSLGFALAQTIQWSIVITPSGGGKVIWSTSSPVANGTLTASGKISFNTGALVDLTFTNNPGFELKTVFKNADDWTPFLDSSKHYQFGPVSGAHTIVAVFSALVPTGDFNFKFPTNNPSVTAITDVTGNYTGVTPTHHRNYDLDLAMDEGGKLAVMGTVDGIVPTGGGEISGAVGAIKTVNNEPTALLKGSFAGTRDGVATTASGAATGPVELADIGGGSNVVQGTGSYKATVGGVPFGDSNIPMQVPVSTNNAANMRKSWTIDLHIDKQVDPGSGKETILIDATLVLPNGDVIDYPVRAAKYSTTKGYSISLKGGTNTSALPPVVDKKTSVSIKGMTMAQEGDGWVANGGTVSYSFLGQKGTANLVDFLAP